MKLIDKLREKKISTFSIMCVITVVFIFLPLIMKIPVVSDVIAWLMAALKYQEYKSAYLGLVGGLIGSWLAVTGAINVQERENCRRKEIEKNESLIQAEKNNRLARNICKNFLLQEIKRNNLRMRLGNSPSKLLERLIDNPSDVFGPEYKLSISKWEEIRKELITIDIECADAMFSVYRYYEPLTVYSGTLGQLCSEYGVDYKQYENDYNEAIRYIERG